ncbi:MAG: hypothetical protein WCA81_10285 [Rhizomicrobium sp.]
MTVNAQKRGWSVAVVLLGASLLTRAAFANVSDFLGNWVNTDPGASGITRIIVTPMGDNQVRVHVYGQCQPTDCDWGVRPGHSYTENPGSTDVRSIAAEFNAGYSSKTIILRRAPGGDMRFEALTAFTDGSGRNDYDITGRLALDSNWGVPSGGSAGGGPGGIHLSPGGFGIGLMGPEDCVALNPAAVTATMTGGSWRVVQGPTWILDYGSNRAAAQRAADVIRNYQFDQQCFVKRSNATMMYWKSGGHVPSGGMIGDDCMGFNPTSVSVSFAGGAWKVVDGARSLLDYGPDQSGANQALAVIRNNHLNRECFIVRPHASMSYWLAQ